MDKQFEIVDGKAVGKLVRGMGVPGGVAKDFAMREYTVADLLAAEAEASAMTPIAFNANLMALQLERVGSFTGPFTLNMIKALKPADWQVLRAAQQELERLGEDGPSGSAEA